MTEPRDESQFRHIDLERALERTGGDRSLIREIAQLACEEFPGRLDLLSRAMDAGDLQELEMHAHTLKGSAGFLAAEALYDTSSSLEKLARQGRREELHAALMALQDAVDSLAPELRSLATETPLSECESAR